MGAEELGWEIKKIAYFLTWVYAWDYKQACYTRWACKGSTSASQGWTLLPVTTMDQQGQCNAILGHDLQRMITYLKAKVCRWAKVKSQVQWGIPMVGWREMGPGGRKRVLPVTPLHSVEKSEALEICSELRNVVSTSCGLQNWRKWNCFEDIEVLHPLIFVQLGFNTAFIYGPSLPNYF